DARNNMQYGIGGCAGGDARPLRLALTPRKLTHIGASPPVPPPNRTGEGWSEEFVSRLVLIGLFGTLAVLTPSMLWPPRQCSRNLAATTSAPTARRTSPPTSRPSLATPLSVRA